MNDFEAFVVNTILRKNHDFYILTKTTDTNLRTICMAAKIEGLSKDLIRLYLGTEIIVPMKEKRLFIEQIIALRSYLITFMISDINFLTKIGQ